MVHPHLFGPISTVGYAEAVKIVADYLSSSIPCSSQNPSVLKKVLEKYRIADMDASEALLQKIIQVLSVLGSEEYTFVHPFTGSSSLRRKVWKALTSSIHFYLPANAMTRKNTYAQSSLPKTVS